MIEKRDKVKLFCVVEFCAVEFGVVEFDVWNFVLVEFGSYTGGEGESRNRKVHAIIFIRAYEHITLMTYDLSNGVSLIQLRIQRSFPLMTYDQRISEFGISW